MSRVLRRIRSLRDRRIRRSPVPKPDMVPLYISRDAAWALADELAESSRWQEFNKWAFMDAGHCVAYGITIIWPKHDRFR